VVQNLDTQFRIRAFQIRDKRPALFIYQDLNQGPNGFAFVGGAGGVLPKPPVVFGFFVEESNVSRTGVREGRRIDG